MTNAVKIHIETTTNVDPNLRIRRSVDANLCVTMIVCMSYRFGFGCVNWVL